MTLPSWAVVTPARRGHVERVAALIATWATAMKVPERERARWVSAAWLHDALRDAPAANELAHGPLAAERAAHDGLTDQGVLDAVRYHSLGFAQWDDVGRMLYLADYLEPGRAFDQELRRSLAARVPQERAGSGDARAALWRTGGAVALCSATTVIGYLVLLGSDTGAIRSFGLAAVLGEAACLASALIVAPAALVLLRRLRK